MVAAKFLQLPVPMTQTRGTGWEDKIDREFLEESPAVT